MTVERAASAPRLDPVIHPASRLLVCACLAPASQVEFAVLQRTVGLSASALSKQVHILIDAGYVAQVRDVIDSRRIWLRLTTVGRAAYRSHLTALQDLIATGHQAGMQGDADGSGGEEFEATS